MIHSLAGGSFREKRIADFAKVEILEGIMQGEKYWYILDIGGVVVGDNVLVPLGVSNIKTTAKVLRVDKNVQEGHGPIPFKVAKKVISKARLLCN